MKTVGGHMVNYARLCRAVTNYAPTRDFVPRFKKEGHPYCVCDPEEKTIESREHVLYYCPFWIWENIEMP
jgi:hypothetical protein